MTSYSLNPDILISLSRKLRLLVYFHYISLLALFVYCKITDVIQNLGGLRFGTDADGNYGYIKDGADTVTPFKQLPMDKYLTNGGMDTSRNSFSKTVTLPKGNYLVALAMANLNTGAHPTSSHGILLSNGNYTNGSSSVYYLQLTSTTTVTFHYPCGWDYTGWSYNILI